VSFDPPRFPEPTPSGPSPTPDGGWGVPIDVEPPPVPVRFQHRYRIHVLLLLATVATTTFVGALHYDAFRAAFQLREPRFDLATLLGGFWYSGALLAILGAHEMGHYFMCRRHRVDATLPYFLPAPLPLTGTVGAFIRIREMFPSKAVLFDIGVGGPIAGFVVLVPALFWGLAMSNIAPLPHDFAGLSLGEPLLFKVASWLVWGPIPDGYSINLHPMAFAAWFGLIATALNLMPFGQLDGGHIAYAALGPRATLISLATVLTAVGLTLISSSWLVVTIMMLVMLFTVGARHPRVYDEHVPLDPTRRWIAFGSAVIFILCFTPAPIEPYQLISNP
jgi:membrane-associated protease RseP (regulator of RpoE activity)